MKLLKILTHSGLASCRYYALTHQHECGALTVHLLMSESVFVTVSAGRDNASYR